MTTKNKAAQALAALAKGKKKTMSPAAIAQRKAAGSVEKKGEVHRATLYRRAKKLQVGNTVFPPTTVMLFKNSDGGDAGQWWISSLANGDVPSVGFKTATAARRYAAANNWAVKRVPDCDC
jgi:hypothetical protein